MFHTCSPSLSDVKAQGWLDSRDSAILGNTARCHLKKNGRKEIKKLELLRTGRKRREYLIA